MKLSKDQCIQLDKILKEFGPNDSLSREQILEMFVQDEKLANALVQVLISNGLISKSGNVMGQDLPMMIFIEPQATILLANGGFETEYNKKAEKILADTSFQELQKKNVELQNENLNYQKTIRDQEERIRVLDEKNKFIELFKNYWWLIVSAFALGGALAKFFLK